LHLIADKVMYIIPKESDIDSNTYRTSYHNRMKKLNNTELMREFNNAKKYPSGTPKDQFIKIRMQVLELLASERGILL
jgi:hypothetical protein